MEYTGDSVLFQERQHFEQWKWFFVFALLMILAIAGLVLFLYKAVPDFPPVLFLPVAIPVFLFVLLGFIFSRIEMITEIRYDGLYIRFSPLMHEFKHYPFDSIESCEPSDGGLFDRSVKWSIKRHIHGTSYRCGSRKKVLFKLKDGKFLLIDTRTPDKLQEIFRYYYPSPTANY